MARRVITKAITAEGTQPPCSPLALAASSLSAPRPPACAHLIETALVSLSCSRCLRRSLRITVLAPCPSSTRTPASLCRGACLFLLFLRPPECLRHNSWVHLLIASLNYLARQLLRATSGDCSRGITCRRVDRLVDCRDDQQRRHHAVRALPQQTGGGSGQVPNRRGECSKCRRFGRCRPAAGERSNDR